MIEIEEGTPQEDIKLVYGGKEMLDGFSLEQCGVEKDSTIEIEFRTEENKS